VGFAVGIELLRFPFLCRLVVYLVCVCLVWLWWSVGILPGWVCLACCVLFGVFSAARVLVLGVVVFFFISYVSCVVFGSVVLCLSFLFCVPLFHCFAAVFLSALLFRWSFLLLV